MRAPTRHLSKSSRLIGKLGLRRCWSEAELAHTTFSNSSAPVGWARSTVRGTHDSIATSR
jgi:hypothetical protein